jgi:hypothetical protein
LDREATVKSGHFGASLLLLAVEPRYKAWPAPKLNVVPSDKALCLLDSFGVVGTNQRLEPVKMSIVPDDVGSVFCHPESPLTDG